MSAAHKAEPTAVDIRKNMENGGSSCKIKDTVPNLHPSLESLETNGTGKVKRNDDGNKTKIKINKLKN